MRAMVALYAADLLSVGYLAPWRDKTSAKVTSHSSGVEASSSDGIEKYAEYCPQSREMSLQLPSYSHPAGRVLSDVSA
jgi:hypothetical protein